MKTRFHSPFARYRIVAEGVECQFSNNVFETDDPKVATFLKNRPENGRDYFVVDPQDVAAAAAAVPPADPPADPPKVDPPVAPPSNGKGGGKK